jgi:hypothetical protein
MKLEFPYYSILILSIFLEKMFDFDFELALYDGQTV